MDCQLSSAVDLDFGQQLLTLKSRTAGLFVDVIFLNGSSCRFLFFAVQDGRLQSGDHILQIGEVSLRGMGSEQVAAVLRQSGTQVRLVVARPIEPTSPDYQVTIFPFLLLTKSQKFANR